MRKIRKPDGANLEQTTRLVTAGDLLDMRVADEYVYITTAGVVRAAAQIWADRNDKTLGNFNFAEWQWLRVLSDTAPVTVHGYNGAGIWDVRAEWFERTWTWT